jgi:hypothetical protein
MSNSQAIGKHSMAVVHRLVKRRKRAGARARGNYNRRLITLGPFDIRGPHSQKTLALAEKEFNYHFTKGFRSRNA